MTVNKYRKKPAVIEAMKVPQQAGTPEADDLFYWLQLGLGSDVTYRADGAVEIKTLEGVMRADTGDYIIKGVQGEFYPCKPDIFHATYEVVGDA